MSEFTAMFLEDSKKKWANEVLKTKSSIIQKLSSQVNFIYSVKDLNETYASFITTYSSSLFSTLIMNGVPNFIIIFLIQPLALLLFCTIFYLCEIQIILGQNIVLFSLIQTNCLIKSKKRKHNKHTRENVALTY